MAKVALNSIEKIGAILSPQWAVNRLRAKTILAVAGGYSGASRQRPGLQAWNPGSGDAASDLSFDLQTLRGRSRDLCRNAPLAIGAVNTRRSANSCPAAASL